MATTIADVDARLEQLRPGLHAPTYPTRQVTRWRLDYYLDVRLQLANQDEPA